jgi:hypothetical protein
MATVATTTLAATITTAVLDQRDHVSGSKGIQDARRTCRLSRLPSECRQKQTARKGCARH